MLFTTSWRRMAVVALALGAAIVQTGCGGGAGSSAGAAQPLAVDVGAKVRALSALRDAAVAAPNPDLPDYLGPQVLGIVKVAERRVSRTVYDYDFVVQLKNGSSALSQLLAVLADVGAGSTIVSASAEVGELAADATVTSSGKVTIRHDRSLPFSSALTWRFKGIVSASRDPIVVQRADPAMIRTLSDGHKVVMGQLMAITDGSQSLEQDVAMFAALGAEVVGRVPEANAYQLRLPTATDEATLLAARQQLAGESRIVAVTFNSVSETTSGSASYVPNDAFVKSQLESLGAAHVSEAWKTIQQNFSYGKNVNNGNPALKSPVIGVIDAGFTDDLSGELSLNKRWGPEGGDDWGLNPALSLEKGERTHGMHVAGIIAAIGDNNCDPEYTSCGNMSQIAGMAWQAKPTVNVARSDFSLAVELGHIVRLARSGARVINKSMGYYEPSDRTGEARLQAGFLKSLFNKGYDFLLILSAGNSFNDAVMHQPLANLFQATGWDEFAEVKSRVLVVANADTTDPQERRLSSENWFSLIKFADSVPPYAFTQLWCDNCGPTNYGIGVEIAAPGASILSLSDERNPTDARDGIPRVMSGSSMAAPFVAGVAATVFAINDKLKASDVKSLIIDEKNVGAAVSFDLDFWDLPYGVFDKKNLANVKHPLVDMQKVVVAAIKTIGKGDYNPTPPSNSAVFLSFSCQWPVVNESGEKSSSYFFNIKLAKTVGSTEQEMSSGWGGPVMFYELDAGKYILRFQREKLSDPWSTSAKTYEIELETPDPAPSEAQSIYVKFNAADEAGCAGALATLPPPVVTHSSAIKASLRSSLRSELFDDFPGTAIDATKWNIDGWEGTGNDYTGGLGRGIGPVDNNNGLVEFGRVGRISTKGKVTFSGDGSIVIEGRMAGTGSMRDSSAMLVDVASGDQILIGDTNYAGFGFYALGIGSYKLKEAGIDPSNALSLGSSTTAFMEYRLTIIGDRIKIERGPTLANITQTGTGTLGRSIVGRAFHISIGAAWAYYPATWDWIRVKTGSPAPLLNPSNGRRYEVIECGTWTSCRIAARAKGGELATVRSQPENDWLIANVLWQARTEWGLWIGLTDEQQEGVWLWSNGEQVTFRNWRYGEPNNLWVDSRPEAYGHMWRGSAAATYLPGVWNDIIDQPILPGGTESLITQAIVEYLN